MKLSNEAEEILEHLWIITQEMGRKSASFQELKTDKDAPEIKEILSLNYIRVSTDGITLRKEGMNEAEHTVRRHRLAERLMVDVFDVKKSKMEDNACRFEHLLYQDVEESVCTLLGHPKFCPHGKAIPEGICCRKSSKAAGSIVSSIVDTKSGTKSKVAYLHTKDKKKLQKLMAMGILPGVSIEILQKFPSYVVRIGHSQVAMDQEMAEGIQIRLTEKNR